MGLRCASWVLALAIGIPLRAQHIDSVQVFREIPAQVYSTASAEAMAWRLKHAGAAFVTLHGAELAAVNEALSARHPQKHMPVELPGLAYLGLAYVHGGIHVVGLMEDQDLVVNFTARRQYVLADWSDRMKVRALLIKLML